MKKIKKYILDIMAKKHKHTHIFTWLILAASILVLGLTSYYLAEKSAIIHSNNNDQLVDSFMFENHETFREAIFPAAHTFLLKWPLFALSSIMGNTPSVYIYLTIFVYLLTVFGFLYIIYRICAKNKLITALIALCLSSILLLIPAQPFNASLLPVNMAMITTRNLEFLIFFAFIALIIKTKRLHSLTSYSSIVLLALLGATDKFYLMLALAGSFLYIIYQLAFINKKITSKLFYPLISSVIGYVLATIILLALDKFEITHIPSATTAAPFALIGSIWQMLEAIAGALQGIIVNFGAGLFGRTASKSVLPYLVNATLLLVSLIAIYKLFFVRHMAKELASDPKWEFVLWLVITFIAAIIVFIASNHNYVYDARYLTGSLFAGIASLTYLLSIMKVKNKHRILLSLCVVMFIATPLSFIVARSNLTAAINANHMEHGVRTDQAAKVAINENADIIVGDYWFITPAKLKISHDITPVPMSTDACDTPNHFLTSKKWYRSSPDVDKSVYYILRDAGVEAKTFNHGCTMDYLNQKYGKPEKEFVIRGTKEKPIDIIRIYNYDIRTKF